MNRTERLRRLRRTLHEAEHATVARVATMGHLAYYTLVAAEAHGSYRYVAGLLGVLLVLEALGDGHEP